MGLFDFLKPKDEEVDKETKMWNLWEKGKAKAPYAQLMTYESEVNNGGHSQYFFNLANRRKLAKEVEILYTVLPDVLKDNLKRGYDAFAAQEDIADDENDELFDECDEVFYENEKLLIAILEQYADTL